MKHRPFFKFPLVALTTIVLFYVMITGIALLNNWTHNWASVRDQTWGVRYTLLALGCLFTGLFRVHSFHPRFATKYAGWLAATPWRPGMHLPLGPVTLALEDLLLVVPLTLLAITDAGIPGWVPVTAYLLGYCATAVASVRSPLTVWFAFSLVLLPSFPVHFHGHLIVLYAVWLIACWIAHLALAQSLAHFPWDLGDSMRELKRRPRVGLAWPLDRVGPASPPQPIRQSVGFAAAALWGWWTFVLLNLLHTWGDGIGQEMLRTIVVTQLPVFGVTFALLRVFKYCLQYWSPISLWGRLWTGRLIIPGYDYVFISPLIICVISCIFPRMLSPFLPLPIVGAATTGVIVAIYFNAAPSLRSWQLTGHHRLFPGVRREPPEPKPRISRR